MCPKPIVAFRAGEGSLYNLERKPSNLAMKPAPAGLRLVGAAALAPPVLETGFFALAPREVAVSFGFCTVAFAAGAWIRFQCRSTGVGSEVKTKWCASEPV